MMHCFESDDDAEEIQPQGIDLKTPCNANPGHIGTTPMSKEPTWNMMYCFSSDDEVEPQDASTEKTTTVTVKARSGKSGRVDAGDFLAVVDGEENKLRSLLEQDSLEWGSSIMTK